MSSAPPPSEHVRAFREPLLLRTLAWCHERSPYYRERFGETWRDVRTLDDLPLLPVLHRDEIVEHHRELRCVHEPPAALQYTTGTTGTFLHLLRSRDELDFISRFYTQLVQGAIAAAPERPLFLSMTSAYHGTPTGVPGIAYVVTSGMGDRTQAEQTLRLLEHEYDLPGVAPRIGGIVGGDLAVKALTAFLIERGTDPAGFGIASIVLTGGYLSARTKQLLRERWGAAVYDRYSLTEVFGGASEIGASGSFRFDPPLVPEVVHPERFEPVTEGLGRLVLTGLYPFMQMMPLVRYDTGDLVEVVGSPQTGAPDLIVKFVGRARRSIVDATGPQARALLLAAPLHDILEGFPDIASTQRFADVGAGRHLEFAGKLHYRIDSSELSADGTGTLALELGLRYPAWLHEERVVELCSRLRHRLFERFPELHERVRSGRIRLAIECALGENVPPFTMK